MITSSYLSQVTDPDVVIVGGGPTGLTLAIVLRRYGITCRIIDNDPGVHKHSRGKGVQPRTLEVFDDLGIVDEVRAHGLSSGNVRFYSNKKPIAEVGVREPAPPPGIPYPGLLIIPQFQTERILRKRLDDFGVMIERGRELAAFHHDGSGVVTTIKDPETGETEQIRAAYLVGCDGGKSFVRKQLGLGFEGENHDQYWVLGDMEIDGLGGGVNAHAWFDDTNSYLNASKLPGTKAWQVQASVTPNAAGEVEPASLELFQRLFDERSGLPNVRVSNATWLSNYNVKRRMVDHYRKGRVFVAGDAAHIHSPAGGQGLNTGVQDAYNLGWKLALVLQGKAGDALLDTYEEERLPIAQGVLRKSETGNSLFFSSHPAIAFVRRFVLLPILQQPRVTAALLLKTAQLDLNYRGTSLARDEQAQERDLRPRLLARRALQAGDRAPDARVSEAATGAPVRLFDQFRGPHWTLLLFTGANPTASMYHKFAMIGNRVEELLGNDVKVCMIAPANDRLHGVGGTQTVLLDARNESHKLYGARHGGLYLIRPDGYIGFRSHSTTLESLFDYLSQVFRATTPARMALVN